MKSEVTITGLLKIEQGIDEHKITVNSVHLEHFIDDFEGENVIITITRADKNG
jgi:hypothetical protein